MLNSANGASHATEVIHAESAENFPEVDAPQLPDGFYFKVVKFEKRAPIRLNSDHYVVEMHKENAGINSRVAASHLVADYSLFRRSIRPLPLNNVNIEKAMEKTIEIMIKNYRGFKSLYQDLGIQVKNNVIKENNRTANEKFYLGEYKKK